MKNEPTISIRNWTRFQHYHKPKPPWVKLYRDVLGDYTVMYQLEPAERWIVVGLWMVAAETDNAIPCDPSYLTHRLRAPVTKELLTRLQVLGIIEDGASSRESLDKLSSQVETETETEKILTCDEWPIKPRKKNGRFVFPDGFEKAWMEYPKRDSPDSKVDAYRAFRAKVKAGGDPQSLLVSAVHYRKSCEACQTVGTRFVKMAATFWGPSEHWTDYVDPPGDGNGTVRNSLANPNDAIPADFEEGGMYYYPPSHA